MSKACYQFLIAERQIDWNNIKILDEEKVVNKRLISETVYILYIYIYYLYTYYLTKKYMYYNCIYTYICIYVYTNKK